MDEKKESFEHVSVDYPTDYSTHTNFVLFDFDKFDKWLGRLEDAHEREVREHTLEYDIDGLREEAAERADVTLFGVDYIAMPVDADGAPIHVGDTLDGYGKTIEVVELRYGRGGWVLISRDGSGYADTFAFAHHHEPTVEDVLREMTDRCYADEDEPRDRDAIVAEYAAKLQLRENK